MKEYTYNCIDKSILLPYFKKYYVSFFFKFVPRGLTANFITLISTSFIIYLLYASTRPDVESSATFALLLAFCLHNYLVGDHLDGMQAKATGTGSPLGEYMDHYLDVYNGAIVLLALTVFFGPLPKLTFYWFIVFNALSFAITMVEELERQELVFGLLGTLEGIVLLVLFFVTWAVEPVRDFWNQELFQGYARYWLVILFFGLGYIGTIVDVARRIGYFPRQFLVFTLATLLMAYSLYQSGYSNIISWLCVTLYSGEYISKVMESYLIGKKHKYPDLLVLITVSLASMMIFLDILRNEIIRNVIIVMMVYLGFKVVTLFVLVVFQLKHHWIWVNPSA
jgi:ethanolaminephosphotransferase